MMFYGEGMINYDDDDYGGVRCGEEMMVMIDLRWGRRSGVCEFLARMRRFLSWTCGEVIGAAVGLGLGVKEVDE